VISTLTMRGRGLTSVWSSSAASAIAQLMVGNRKQSVPALLAHSNAIRCKASHPVAITLAGTAGTRMRRAL
jgi:hypothetical protein